MTEGFAKERDGSDEHHKDHKEDHPGDRGHTTPQGGVVSVFVGWCWLIEVIAHSVSFVDTDIAVR